MHNNFLLAFFINILFSVSLSYAANDVVVERHALVVGNSDYIVQPLDNPRNDAIDMAKQLQELGYKVHNGGPFLDLDRIGIERTVRAFARQLPENANALFYYAGHGMAVDKDNYLIPTRHNLESEDQLPDRAVSLRSIIRVLKNANRQGLNVFLLDACRDNPLENSYRSTRAGMTRLEDIPRGVFVGYAADAGQVAEDGQGRNGTYTSELLNVMRERPNVIIELAHKDVSARVFEKTGGKQFPVSENKVYGDWCFGNCEVDAQGDEAEKPEVVLTEQTTTPKTVPVSPSVEAPPSQPAARSSGISAGWIAAGAAAVVLLGALAAGSGGDGGTTDSNFTLEVIPPDLTN